MLNTIITIIIILVVLVGFVVLFYFADLASKGGSKKIKAESGASKEKSDAAQNITGAAPNTNTPNKDSVTKNDSTLADEIDAMISKEPPKKATEEHESASSRSRMHMRRAHMMQYYEKKYKGRDASFIDDAFDMSSNKSNLVVDGVEITQDDIKKLTALQGLLKRKELDE